MTSYRKKPNSAKPTKWKKPILIAVLFLIVCGGVVTLELLGVTNFYTRPLTSEEKQAKEREKEDNVTGQIDKENLNDSADSPDTVTESNSDPEASNNDNSQKKNVYPTLTRWGQNGSIVEAAGYVTGAFEDGGTCTYIFKKGDAIITAKSQGVQDVANTSCAGISVPSSRFSSGNWTLTLSYSSTTSTGESKGEALAIN